MLLERKVLSEVHGFRELEPASFPGGRNEKIAGAAFRPPKMECSVRDMRKVIGATPSAKPDWYSPGVESLPVEHLELSLMRWARPTTWRRRAETRGSGSL